MNPDEIAYRLAVSLTTLPPGEPTTFQLVLRASLAVGVRIGRMRPIVRRLLASFPQPAAWNRKDVSAFFLADEDFREALTQDAEQVAAVVCPHPIRPTRMRAGRWPVPKIATPGALAARLGLTLPRLDWFADVRCRQDRLPPGPLRHYSHTWIGKPSGDARLLEVPKQRLRVMQRRILDDVLAVIPPHDAAHGFRAGRGIITYAEPHCGKAVVIRLDLRHFFASVRASRVFRAFRAMGYPVDVSRLLTGLCTTRTPMDAWANRPTFTTAERNRHRVSHLPQGAPTSPALANLCAYRLDVRLSGLAESVGAVYTRYADDLAFSGGEELERAARRFQVTAKTIALEEGFEIHARKSRFMRQGVCQQLCGIVVNERPNVKRSDYDALKAILHNCAKLGPSSQNRAGVADFRAHLLGRVAHAAQVNPARGAKLRAAFDRICWVEG